MAKKGTIAISATALALTVLTSVPRDAVAHFYEIKGPYFVADPVSTSSPLATGDVDGDGDSDLVACFSSNRIIVLRQDGDRRLHAYFDAPIWTPFAPVPPSTIYPYSSECLNIGVADINGDSRDDIVLTHNAGVTILLARAAGGFSRQETSRFEDDTSGMGKASGVLIDFDDDGKTDLLVNRMGGVVGWLKNDGSGHLADEATLPALTIPGRMKAGDLNSDGRADIAVAGTQYVFPGDANSFLDMYIKQPGGSFVALPRRQLPAATYARTLAIGDVSGDGRNDIVIPSSANRPRAALFVLKQDAGGIAANYDTYLTLDIPDTVAIADMDGDGFGDIVANHNGWSTVGTYLQIPGSFVAGMPISNLANNNDDPQAFAIADFDSDGCKDIAASVSGQYVMAYGKDCLNPDRIFMARFE
jgi:hypothetical protein